MARRGSAQAKVCAVTGFGRVQELDLFDFFGGKPRHRHSDGRKRYKEHSRNFPSDVDQLVFSPCTYTTQFKRNICKPGSHSCGSSSDAGQELQIVKLS